MRLAPSSLLIATLACSAEEQIRLERSQFIDTGALCVHSELPSEVVIDVILDGCGSGCSGVLESACELTVSAGEITVHSSIEVGRRRGPGLQCPTECVPIAAACAPIPISPGEYRLVHGDASATVSLPTEMQLLLRDEGRTVDSWCDPAGAG